MEHVTWEDKACGPWALAKAGAAYHQYYSCMSGKEAGTEAPIGHLLHFPKHM